MRRLDRIALRHPWLWAVAFAAPMTVAVGLVTRSSVSAAATAVAGVVLGGLSMSRGPARRNTLRRLGMSEDWRRLTSVASSLSRGDNCKYDGRTAHERVT